MTQFMVIQATRDFTGPRFSVKTGQQRVLRYGYRDPNYVPKIVRQARNSEDIEWGGAVVSPDFYQVIYEGPWPLPKNIRF